MDLTSPMMASTPIPIRDFDSSPTICASSVIKKTGMSITLPRNFAPSSLDPSEAPRTPDQIFSQLELPPPPHHSTYRMRRPRVNLHSFEKIDSGLPTTLFASEIPVPSSAGPLAMSFLPSNDPFADDPLPSIEQASTPTRPQLVQSYSEPVDSQRLRLGCGLIEPRTPQGQTTQAATEIRREEWDMRRAASVCSHRSDSSISTTETYETRRTSYDGSVISHDNDLHDPFSPTEHVKVIPATPQRKSKKQRVTNFFKNHKIYADWTIEMDNHLFNVYQMYLADPTVTPFKTVPGSIPPTGVCHRVARRSKETWPRASRIEMPIVQRYKVRNVLDIRMTPRAATPDPENFLSTSQSDTRPLWPSESATRKRLKQLCREKFTITAHYNRMRVSRSPSPFAEQFLPRRPSRLSHSPINNDNENAYKTRELHINLVASGATEPLAQLTTGDSSPAESALEDFNREQDDFDSNKMNTSPPTGLGITEQPIIDTSKLIPAIDLPRLASPFTYNTWNGPVRPTSKQRRHVSQHHFDTMHATRPRLLSPFQSENDLAANVNKRRAQHNLEDELSPSGSSLAGHTSGLHLDEPLPIIPPEEPKQELIFQGFGDLNQRRVRLRNRGATLGTAHERIAQMFAPPQEEKAELLTIPVMPSQFGSTTLMPPALDSDQRRLGSPFELDPNKRSFRNKPRHLPSLSDPFIQFTHGMPSAINSTQQNSAIGNIGDRLASFEQSLGDYRASPS